MKINLAKNLKKRLTTIMSKKIGMSKSQINEILLDDDRYSDWLNFSWGIIKEYDMLEVRDFMTWSYLLDTEATIPVEVEYFFDELN